MAFSFTVRQGHNSTGRLRSAPAMLSSLKPSGVVGGSKQAVTSIAGSTPMETEIGSGWPNSVARSAMAPIWRLPGCKKMESSSLDWMHIRWMVTSESPVSGWVA